MAHQHDAVPVGSLTAPLATSVKAEPMMLFSVLRTASASLALLLPTAEVARADETAAATTGATMQVRDLYPLITTPTLFQARDFYVTHFGFDVAFQASWFVYLVGQPDGDSRGATLAFMHPDHPSVPPGPESFDGRG